MSGAEPLCAQERKTISRELGRGRSAHRIGKLLGRAHSTIAHEIECNGVAANYRACAAQEREESFKAVCITVSHRADHTADERDHGAQAAAVSSSAWNPSEKPSAHEPG